MEVERWIRLPELVEAVRVTEENLDEVAQWSGGIPVAAFLGSELPRFVTLDKDQHARPGDWVVRNESGAYLCVTHECFTVLYAQVEGVIGGDVRTEAEGGDEG